MTTSNLIISCGWMHKIGPEITIQRKSYDIHPSLLPKYRDKSPLERQPPFKEELFEWSLHLIDDDYDTGPVLKQVAFKSNSEIRIEELLKKKIVRLKVLLNTFKF